MSDPTTVPPAVDSWRSSAHHLAEQFSRFIRLTLLAAIPSLVNLLGGSHFDWKTLLAFILPFAEVAYRQVWPALPIHKAAAAATSGDAVAVVEGEPDAAVEKTAEKLQKTVKKPRKKTSS